MAFRLIALRRQDFTQLCRAASGLQNARIRKLSRQAPAAQDLARQDLPAVGFGIAPTSLLMGVDIVLRRDTVHRTFRDRVCTPAYIFSDSGSSTVSRL